MTDLVKKILNGRRKYQYRGRSPKYHPFIYYTLFINELKGGTLGNVPINKISISFHVKIWILYL